MTRRLVLSYLLLTLAILASLEIPLAITYNERLEDDLSANLVSDSFAIAGLAEETIEGNASLDLGTLTARYAARTGGRIIIVTQDGRVVADSRPDSSSSDFSTRPEIEAALRGEVASGTRHSDTLDTDLLYVAVPIASGGNVHGAVRITYSTTEIDDRWHRYLLTLVAIAAVSMAAAALLGVLFARWVGRPLRQLEGAAAAFGQGDLTARAPTAHGPPEVRELAATFNTMALRLDELVRSQEAFVADASHQLRTPLAALRLRIENLQSDLEESSSQEGEPGSTMLDDVEASLEETRRLSRIVDGLLALARADRAAPTGASTLDVARVLGDRRVAWEQYAEDHGMTISTDLPGRPGQVVASEDRVTQVLDNLIANAVNAGRPGGNIVLTSSGAEGGPSSIDLHVIDDGPGLSAEERERAFDRFWRSSVGPQRGGGTGLGLAIARQLAQADHGDIELRPADTGGLDAVVRLPAG